MHLQALMFDALGTLVALEPPAPRLRAELRSRLGVEVSPADAARAIAAEIAYYRAHLDEGVDAESLASLRARCAAVVGEQLGLGASVPAKELTRALLASLEFTPFADVAPSLRALRARGLRLGVVSNWDVSLHDVLARLELSPLLDAVVTSAEAGGRKPLPAPFVRALSLLRIAPGDAVYVGDSVAEDVAGARAAGIKPVLLRRDGGASPGGVRVIASLAELDGVLAA